MEPHTCANQVLPKAPALARVHLGARVFQIVILNEGAELRIPVVVRTADHLPREIGMVPPTARLEIAAAVGEVYSGRLRIVNADATAEIRLKSIEGWNRTLSFNKDSRR